MYLVKHSIFWINFTNLELKRNLFQEIQLVTVYTLREITFYLGKSLFWNVSLGSDNYYKHIFLHALTHFSSEIENESKQSVVDSGSGWFYFLLYSDNDCSVTSVSFLVTLACVASVSVGFGSKELQRENGASKRRGRGRGRKEGNACWQTPAQ